ncbi:hypothetical protein Fmac_009135 [Flemingia macrophylla]|uniref:ATP synthase F0 subunit 8 n=1 Tax=Flemingia macrophylla TaxID=520843 RepID=A0ABD1N1V6_9FABA
MNPHLPPFSSTLPIFFLLFMLITKHCNLKSYLPPQRRPQNINYSTKLVLLTIWPRIPEPPSPV